MILNNKNKDSVPRERERKKRRKLTGILYVFCKKKEHPFNI